MASGRLLDRIKISQYHKSTKESRNSLYSSRVLCRRFNETKIFFVRFTVFRCAENPQNRSHHEAELWLARCGRLSHGHQGILIAIVNAYPGVPGDHYS